MYPIKHLDNTITYRYIGKNPNNYIRFNNEFDKMLEPIIPSNVERDLRKYPLWLTVCFRNGYSSKSPQIQCKCKLRIVQGKKEWGAELGKEYYILDIIQVCYEDPIFK